MTRSRRHGFSLLEVLLATSILIGSAIVLVELVTIGNRHASTCPRAVQVAIDLPIETQ